MSNVYESTEPSFKEELEHLLNKHSMDNQVGIPDFLLAEFLTHLLVDMEHMNRDFDQLKKRR